MGYFNAPAKRRTYKVDGRKPSGPRLIGTLSLFGERIREAHDDRA